MGIGGQSDFLTRMSSYRGGAMGTGKIWTKSFLVVMLMNFLLTMNFYLLMVTVSVFAMRNFHASHSEAGLAVTRHVGGVPGLGKGLFEIVGSLAIVLDDENLHGALYTRKRDRNGCF